MSSANNGDHPEPLHPQHLTWAALLSQWMEFARRAVGLPTDDAGQRLRDSVTDIITLQAVTFALDNLDELAADERALGLDRAEVLIERHTAALHQRWENASMPDELNKLIDDARRRLAQAQRDYEM